MVLVATMLVSITVAVALNVASLRLHSTQLAQQKGNAYYAAEAGIQMVFSKLGRVPRPPPFDTDPNTWPQDDPRRPGMPSKVDNSVTIFERQVERSDGRRVSFERPVSVRVTRIAAGPDRFEVRATADYEPRETLQ